MAVDIFDPYIAFICIYFLYSIASAIRISSYRYDDIGFINDSVLSEYYFSTIVGLWGFGIGGLVKSKKLNISKNIFANKHFINVLYFTTIISSIILFPFYYTHFDFLNIRSYSETAFSSRLEFYSSSSNGLKEVFLKNLPITLIFTVCTIEYFRQKRNIYKFLWSSPMIIFIVVNTLSGWRGLVVSAAIIPVVYYHYQIKRIRMGRILLLGVILYSFMPIISIVRSSSDPKVMIEILTKVFQNRGLMIFALENNGELITGVNLMTQIRGFETGQITYNYGFSIITDLLSFIPRIFFQERPDSMPYVFTKTFYPEVYRIGGGYGFFCIQEGYWAFGKIGVFISMFFYSRILIIIYSFFMRYMSPIIAIIYSHIFISLAIFSVRTGLISSFKSIIMNLLPFILIASITYFLIIKTKNQRIL